MNLSGSADARSAWRHALWILAASTLLRLVYAAVVPLVPDEAYYWEWSRRLAGGYFDHPPVIAVLIAGGTALLGDTPLGVRLLPVLAGTLAGLGIAATARHLAGDRAARFAALVFVLLPLAAAGLVLATPDAPLVAALAWTLYAVVRALDATPDLGRQAGAVASRRAATFWWLAAGLAIGLAMASKFTGVLYPLAIVLAMLVHPSLRSRILTPGPWLAVALASCVMLPVLWWNAQHDWVAFRFQLGHGLGATARGSALQREGSLLAGQAALVTPILLVLLAGAAWRALRAPRDAMHRGPRFVLGAVAASCAAFFIYSATRKSVEPNWPAIAILPALVLLASAQEGARTAWERRGTWLAGALTAVMLVHVLVPVLPIRARRDPPSQAHGWAQLARAVDSARAAIAATPGPASWAELGLADDPRRHAEVFVAANRYQDAAALRFHLPAHPTVFALNLGARRNQYDLWPRFPDRAARGAALLLVLEEPDSGLPGPIRRLDGHFASLTSGPLVRMVRDTAYIGRRRLWVLGGWRGTWPADSSDLLPSR